VTRSGSVLEVRQIRVKLLMQDCCQRADRFLQAQHSCIELLMHNYWQKADHFLTRQIVREKRKSRERAGKQGEAGGTKYKQWHHHDNFAICRTGHRQRVDHFRMRQIDQEKERAQREEKANLDTK
jgi:hypothetical protein